MPLGQEVADSTAIGSNKTVETPFIAEYLLLVTGLCTAGLSVDTLIGTHHLCHLTLLYESLEGREVCLPEIALGEVLDIKGMAIPFRAAVYGEVLGASQEFFVTVNYPLSTICHALQTTHHCQTHLCCKIGVFAVCLLSASPARVTEDIDVRCPERKTLVSLDIA